MSELATYFQMPSFQLLQISFQKTFRIPDLMELLRFHIRPSVKTLCSLFSPLLLQQVIQP
nr:MAG TPA: hypothetical protein [Caudoviricetes sp.]